jgi:uncharacterized membrane protein YeaQ/YmgE (transglycosylase-associated protein family)
MGIQMASAYIGSLVMPPLFGQIASFSGFYIFPFFMGAMLLLNILMVEMLNKRVNKRG